MGVDRRLLLQSLGAMGLAPALAEAAQELRDDGARVEALSDNVFAILHEDADDERPHGNVGVIVGRRSVFVIESNNLPSRARADIALIRRITDKPVSKLAATHWSFDHTTSAIAYKEAFPDVELIAERKTARWIELNQTWWSLMAAQAASQRRAAVAELEAALACGVDEDGAPLHAEERAARADIIARQQTESRELETLQVVTADRLFDERLKLNFEGTRVEIRDWGPASSAHDLTFWLPRQRILFAGDILAQSPLPCVGASWPAHWAPVLRQIERLPIARSVPGRGPVLHDHSYTRAMRALLEAALDRVEDMARAGKTPAQIQDELNLDDVRARVPEWSGPGASAEDWDRTRRLLAERAWMGLRDQDAR
jgi:glyoxylase-like metal-dependent hydrolase (beta-lactamase superfamily II)